MGRKSGKQSKEKLDSIKTVLLMEGLSSREHYYIPGEAPRRILKDINLLMERAESWGIYGQSPLEIKLLLEIMANIIPYHDGRCILVERGMMRKKRVILDHIFYIGAATMPYDNMNVLEFLMFTTAKQGDNPVFRQKELFELLIAFGLDHISLSPIRLLTKEEKATITLLVAAYSDSVMIVFNLPHYTFDGVLFNAIGKISKLITAKKKTFIIGTLDSSLIEKTCSHTAYLRDGVIIYRGTVENLRLRYDNVLLTVEDKNASQMVALLNLLLPQHRFSLVNDHLLVCQDGATRSDPFPVYKQITEAGLAPQAIKINPKTVQNAYREIDRQYDLRKQLFK